jgi:uncharacterized protein DUF6088
MGGRTTSAGERQTARRIRERIARGGERLWRLADFPDAPMPAVAQALSRLAKKGELHRLSKGVYYRPRQTALGVSRPNPSAVRDLAGKKTIFPSGIAAANLLGFTTQSAGRTEVATSASSLPRKLIGADTVVHTRRPPAWSRLSETDTALLDFLRNGGTASELPPQETIKRLLALLREGKRYDRLLKVAATEPPRVRAMLGALGEALGNKARARALERLRASLNPLSRYDFGILTALPAARAWQARERRPS